MDGNADGDRDRALGAENSAAEGDADRGSRYGMARCASQSSLDESSQRPMGGGGAGAGGGGDAGGGETQRHATALLGALARLRGSTALCDVRLRAGPEGPPLAAHRAVLAAASPYFHAMFTQFDERTQPEVTIQDIEPAALEAIVEYVYAPDSLIITEDNVQALLSGASLVALGGVRDACCAFLGAALVPENALGIRAFADLHACADLKRHATDYVDAHFAQVLETEEFLALTADTLAQLLDSDRIMVPDEEVVLDAVIKWMQHAPAERQPHLGSLLEHVRLPLLPQEALVARAAAEPLAGAGAGLRVKDLVIEALSFHLLPPARRAQAAAGCARARPRCGARGAGALLVAGGQAPKAIRDVELLRLDAGGWRCAAPLPSRRCRAGLAVVDGRAYAVGGFNGTLRVRSVDVYDIAADAWSAGPPLGARRSTLGVAALGGTIYAVGGFDGAAGLSSAEALDAGAAAWRPVAGMSTRRSSVGVAVLDGKLYAVGGYDGAARQCLHTVERYSGWESYEAAGSSAGAGQGAVAGACRCVLYSQRSLPPDADEVVYESVGAVGWGAAQTLEFNARQGAVAGAVVGGTVPRRGARWPLRVEVRGARLAGAVGPAGQAGGGTGESELPPCLLLLQRWPRAECSYHLLPESQRRADVAGPAAPAPLHAAPVSLHDAPASDTDSD